MRIGIAAAITLIMLIGGRIIPSFTRNWLVRENPGRLPVPFGRIDIVSIAIAVAALAVWVVRPEGPVTGAALLIAGIMQAARWAGERTVSERLLLILHVGYAFVPLGFVLVAAAAFGLVLASAGIHAWTAGAVGTMTLAVMSRASLGHTGRTLTADWATQLVYGARWRQRSRACGRRCSRRGASACCMWRPSPGRRHSLDLPPRMGRCFGGRAGPRRQLIKVVALGRPRSAGSARSPLISEPFA